ncbi:MAG: polysaccharide deacetylase family protein [Clostridia bacterium]|nr:polysaccharide deacetylase family protein [Clostridia bacterium]
MNFEMKNLIYRILIVTLILVISIIVEIAVDSKFMPEENKEVVNSGENSVKTSVNLPILMYHHLVDDADNEMAITPELFEEHIRTILANGYVPVSLEEVAFFVEGSGDLPEKPICITFDDGYLSNYEIAFPLLKKYNAKAAIAIVGTTVGATTYKDTGVEIIPHFDFEHAKEMEESGLISIISHTYDMHQSELLESGDEIRISIGKLQNETEEEYERFLKKDFEKISSMIRENLGKETIAVAYPRGVSDDVANKIFKEAGVKITLATTNGINKIEKGNLDSMYKLNRYTIGEHISCEELMRLLDIVK